MKTKVNFPQINQTWLHQKLKDKYLSDVGGAEEVTVQLNGRKYRIDVLDNENGTAYEIHRASFGGNFSEKIKDLLQLSELKIIIVHPIVINQKVTRMKRGITIGTSYYNKWGDIYAFFEKLVYFKTEFRPKRMRFDVLFIKEHVLKEFVGFWRNSNRRRYKIVQRDLISVESSKKFRMRSDFLDLLPEGLPIVFTNRDLAERLEIQGGERRVRRIPGCMTYSLCKLGILSRVGTRGRAHKFRVQAHQ